jgi:hypothetical protein
VGVRTSMQVGRTLAPSPSVFPYVTGTVPRPYGEWYNEALEGTGGWTANAPALLRFVNKMFGRGQTTSLFKAGNPAGDPGETFL